MNRPRRKRELVEVRMMFEPDRFNEHYLKAAYELGSVGNMGCVEEPGVHR